MIKRVLDFLKSFGVKVTSAVLAGFAIVMGSSVPASATLDADVTTLFTAGVGGVTGLQTQYLSILAIFIGLAVVSLAFYAVISGIKKGKRAMSIALAGGAGLMGISSPAFATLDADVTSLFTAGIGGVTGLQTQYLAILAIFIGLAVVSLAFYAVISGIKKGKRAM